MKTEKIYKNTKILGMYKSRAYKKRQKFSFVGHEGRAKI